MLQRTPSDTDQSNWFTARTAPYAAGGSFLLFEGDARETLRTFPSESVDTCVTSPPYWAARDYGVDGQIGQEADVGEYISHLVNIMDEVRRVLKPSGSVWLNVGDKYLSGVGTIAGKPPRYGWKRNKQLSLVPFRLAIALQDAGWWIRNTVVWHKPNGMPISATDRLANHWEPIFLLTKSERYYFNLDTLRVPHKTGDQLERKRALSGGNRGKSLGKTELRRWLNSPRHRVTIDGLRNVERRPNAPEAVVLAAYLRRAAEQKDVSIKDVATHLDQPFERVRHYFRTDPIGSRLPPHETWLRLKEFLDLDGSFDEAMTIETGDNVFRNHPLGRNPGDVKSVAVAPSEFGHFAVMPSKLAAWVVSATLPRDGVCLDPFAGTATTGLAALEAGGRFVGVDIDRDSLKIAHARLTETDR